jgi:putative oxidoreductase
MPISRPMSQRVDAALLVLRVVFGVIMIAHGYQKMFTMGIGAVTGGFTQMGVPAPSITAPLVSCVELLAGAGVLVGLLTRLAALGLAVDMLGAMTFVHFKNGFFLPTGFEYPLALLCIAIALMLAGAGAYSIDAMITGRRSTVQHVE